MTWASTKNYGTMRYWNTSLVTDMSGYDGHSYRGFANRALFNADISRWDTSAVKSMKKDVLPSIPIQSTDKRLGRIQSDEYGMDVFSSLCV